MQEIDVLGYLNTKGTVKRATGTNVHLSCFFCGEDPQKRGRLYVNVDPNAEIPGLFHCKKCDARGSFVSILKHFGDYQPETAPEREVDGEVRRAVFADAARFYTDWLANNGQEALDYLLGDERGLTIETMVDAQLGYAPEGNHLYRHLRDLDYKTADVLATGLVVERDSKLQDSLGGMITIPYKSSGNIVSIRGRAYPHVDGPKYKTLGGNKALLYNSDITWECDEFVITEGEFDALVMGQLGYRAVAVPGANTWQNSWDGYLANARRVWLVFDRDEAGEKGAAKLVDRFGTDKVRPIHLSDAGSKCDPTSWVNQGGTAEQFKELIDKASMGNLLITVGEAIEEHDSVQGQSGLKFGLEMLDLMLEPGLLPAQVMVVLAKAGTGKTIWLLNMMQRMLMVPGQEDLDFLFVSLEQTRGDWWERARRIYRFYNLEATDDDAREFWKDRLLLIDKNRVSSGELNSALDDYQYRKGHQPKCMMIDYLGYFARGYQGEAYERTSAAIMDVKAIGKDRRIPTVIPHQVSRGAKYGEEPDTDAARDSGAVEETADFLLKLWSPDALLGRQEEEKSGVVNCRIGKSRHGGTGTKVVMQFAPLTLALVPHSDAFAQQARDEFEYLKKYRDTWDRAIFRHRTKFSGDLDGPKGEARVIADRNRRDRERAERNQEALH